MKVLITGITGFVGSHLAEHLLSKENIEVYGTYRVRSRMGHMQSIRSRVKLIECELKDSNSVYDLVDRIKPDRVFHLAAQSFVPTSWNSPEDTVVNNTVSQINLFEAVRKYNPTTRIQIACSSEEYGLVHPEETPITEDNPLRPLSPYGVSKVAQDLLGYQYHQSYGLYIVRTRTFNHEGPRRGESFVLSNFAKQVAEIEKGIKKPILYVGNLDAIRDFTDVRDVVRAYWMALENGEPGEVYNIGSGSVWRIGDALEKLLSMSSQKIDVQQDPKRMRPSDVMILHSDATRFMNRTGWKPEIPFTTTLRDMLEYWRARV
jgi:GDP-4-dehydro-6-deoxy-D-mannose reductase